MRVHNLNIAVQGGEHDALVIIESSEKHSPIRLNPYADNLMDRIQQDIINELQHICNAVEEERRHALARR